MKLPVVSIIALASIISLAWAGCSKDKNPDYLAQADCSQVDPIANTYTFAVSTVLNTNCALGGCHDAATQSEGINFSTYATAKAAFQTKDVLCAINHGNGCEPMPKGGSKLPAVQLNILMCWAKNGYLE